MDTSTTVGQKRKRYEPPEEDLSVRIGRKLHHEVKEVHKASKRAKVFETQKVVKRLKDIRKKNEADKSIVDFEAELTSLKEIDHCSIGNSALRTKILKDHTLRENEDVKAAMTEEVEKHLSAPAEAGSTLAKIQSRLLSSKILALQVTSTLNSLKCLLDPTLKQREKAQAAPSIGDDDIERPSKIRKASTAEDPKPKKPVAKSPVIDQDDESGSEPDGDDAGWESGSIDGEGVIEGDDDGWESGSIDDGRPNDGEDIDSEDQSSGQSSVSDDEDEELTVKPVKPKAKSKSKADTKASAKPSKGASTTKMESTFLPSLSVGFVRGGSEDSDFSEDEGKAGGLPKKNRRGQRARRAIWEKKFGSNANHKKKEMEEKVAAEVAASNRNRNRGHKSDINTGSNAIPSRNVTSTQGPPGATVPPRGRSVPQGDSGWSGRTKSVGAQSHSNAKPLAPKSDKTDNKALHPSWEAKRRLKEKESVGIVPSQGTKIKFT